MQLRCFLPKICLAKNTKMSWASWEQGCSKYHFLQNPPIHLTKSHENFVGFRQLPASCLLLLTLGFARFRSKDARQSRCHYVLYDWPKLRPKLELP